MSMLPPGPGNPPPFGQLGQVFAATPSNTAESDFKHFLEAELTYHRNMVGMYEWLLAQQKLGALKGEQGEMLRSIIMAGLNHMASAYQPKKEA